MADSFLFSGPFKAKNWRGLVRQFFSLVLVFLLRFGFFLVYPSYVRIIFKNNILLEEKYSDPPLRRKFSVVLGKKTGG